jgi:NADH-ubiquinone oxidoreductase chain 5
MCAGTLIHHFAHAQDLRQISQAAPQIPITSTTIIIANLALCGAPFLSGFYSKDLILEILLFNPTNSLILIIFALATLLTTIYSTRLTIALLWAPTISTPLNNTHNEDSNFYIPRISIALAATVSGALIN